MRDAIIVGCGIVGATLAKALTGQGLDVLVIDDDREMAGTKPSGGHLKPGWLSGMKKSEYEPAIEKLIEVWGMQEETFVIRPSGIKASVWRVDTDVVAEYPYHEDRITRVSMLHNFPRVVGDHTDERCKLLIVCTGVWLPELVSGIPVKAKQGVSFRFAGKVQPFINTWAPYKQIVAHQQEDNEIWIGDGSAILPKNWDEARTEQCLARCRKAMKGTKLLKRKIMGLRAYCKTGDDPCVVHRLGPRAWAVTGAAKLGTVAAGWSTVKILREMK